LKEFFKDYSVESTSIPTNPRTGRAVGYAFVDLTTKEDADRAIAELSGKEVLERKVSVQLARKPGTSSNGVKKEGENGTAAETQEEESQQPSGSKRGRGGFRGRGRGRGRGNKRGANRERAASGDESATGTTNVPGQVLPLVESTNVKAEPTETPASGSSNAAPGGFKAKKKRGPPENGVPSSTKVMVANLPYELTEDKLKELFAAYEPESAKIALRPIPRYMVRKLQARGEPRKGRGFGFVTLASEDLQKKAVEEMNGKTVEGREIAVKVAIDGQLEHEDGEHAEEEPKETEAQNGTETATEAATEVATESA